MKQAHWWPSGILACHTLATAEQSRIVEFVRVEGFVVQWAVTPPRLAGTGFSCALGPTSGYLPLSVDPPSPHPRSPKRTVFPLLRLCRLRTCLCPFIPEIIPRCEIRVLFPQHFGLLCFPSSEINLTPSKECFHYLRHVLRERI